MKAIINEKYGTPDLLVLREVERPEPQEGEILVKVLAASVNKADWHLLSGSPFPVRLMAGLTKPKYPTLGADVAGVVDRVGSGVTQFKPGDEVFGDLSGSGFGGFAEFVITQEKFLARKPSDLTYEQSAALPMASVTALQGLRDKGGIKQGDKVLINGASGGVGGFAIQIGKAFGANVTAVCSTGKVQLAKDQGADEVIDYTKEDFTKGQKRYDLIFDIVANHDMRAVSQVLKAGGRYVTCAFSMSVMLFGGMKSKAVGKKFTTLLANVNQSDLQFVCKLAEEGKLNPAIQKTYALDDVPEALWTMGRGGTSGKLIITI